MPKKNKNDNTAARQVQAAARALSKRRKAQFDAWKGPFNAWQATQKGSSMGEGKLEGFYVRGNGSRIGGNISPYNSVSLAGNLAHRGSNQANTKARTLNKRRRTSPAAMERIAGLRGWLAAGMPHKEPAIKKKPNWIFF